MSVCREVVHRQAFSRCAHFKRLDLLYWQIISRGRTDRRKKIEVIFNLGESAVHKDSRRRMQSAVLLIGWRVSGHTHWNLGHTHDMYRFFRDLRQSAHWHFSSTSPVASHTVRRTPVPYDRGANFAYDRDQVTQGEQRLPNTVIQIQSLFSWIPEYLMRGGGGEGGWSCSNWAGRPQ